MNSERDRLDDAIDLVAARMTAVEEDDALATRIAAALPDRAAGIPRVWLARLATGALATLAIAVVLRSLDNGATGVGPAKAGDHIASDSVATPDPGHQSANDSESAVGMAGVGPVDVEPRRVSVVSALRRTSRPRTTVDVDRRDHEFSLAAIAAPEGLAMSPLSPGDLPAEDTLTIAPLEIAELPLSSDFPPR